MQKTPLASRRLALLAPFAFLAAQCLAAGSALAADEAFPRKPITIVVPQTPGGANDTVARAVAQKLGARIGQPVIVENRTGAGGNVGTAYVARAPHDGYTLLLTAQSAHTINPFLYRNVPFDPVKDFEPVMIVATAPYVLAVNPSVPAKNLAELIELAKAHPGQLNYASAGNGTMNHLLGEMLKGATGIKITHVPYRGAAPAAADVVGGQAQMAFGSLPGLMPFVRSNQLRALGVATARRSALAPELPTLAETVPGLAVNSWYGVFAPAGTPREVVARLQADMATDLKTPELQDILKGQGAEAAPGTSEELAQTLREELVRWEKIVRESNAKVD
ncbi:MAG: tripartite tricarboxylate transporter substrate binding protein [Pseudomonadota bacterium]